MESFKFGTPEVKRTLTVFGWTLASAVVVLLLDLIQVVDIPAQYVAYIPIVNVVLYGIKEFITDNQV